MLLKTDKTKLLFLYYKQVQRIRACLKNHSRNLHAPLCGIFCPNSVIVARYDALIRTKSLTNCDAHLAESLFQTCSRTKQIKLQFQFAETPLRMKRRRRKWQIRKK